MTFVESRGRYETGTFDEIWKFIICFFALSVNFRSVFSKTSCGGAGFHILNHHMSIIASGFRNGIGNRASAGGDLKYCLSLLSGDIIYLFNIE